MEMKEKASSKPNCKIRDKLQKDVTSKVPFSKPKKPIKKSYDSFKAELEKECYTMDCGCKISYNKCFVKCGGKIKEINR